MSIWPLRFFRQRRAMQLLADTGKSWSRGVGAARETKQKWVVHDLRGTRFLEVRLGRRGICIGWFIAENGVTHDRSINEAKP